MGGVAVQMASRRRPGRRAGKQEWEVRAAPSRRQTARYSRIVGLLRVVLPALAVALLALLALWPHIVGDVALMGGGDGAARPMTEGPHMVNPRYFGTDDRNRPFRVSAERATYVGDEAGVIALERPAAELALDDGAGLRLEAAQGLFDRDAGTAELEGGVTLHDDRGHVVETSRAAIDLRAGVARGDAPVVGRGPFGRIDGAGFEWRNDTGVLRLDGPARMFLRPQEGGEP